MTFRHTFGRARLALSCALLLTLAACGGGAGEQSVTKTDNASEAQANNSGVGGRRPLEIGSRD